MGGEHTSFTTDKIFLLQQLDIHFPRPDLVQDAFLPFGSRGLRYMVTRCLDYFIQLFISLFHQIVCRNISKFIMGFPL